MAILHRNFETHARNAMTYEIKYGRPDLFLTVTCNLLIVAEIKEQLKYGQAPMDRHNIMARHLENK